jgi:hypothetical protein
MYRLNFKHKSFLSTRSKTDNWESLHWSLLSRISLMPQSDISFGFKTTHIIVVWCPDWILNTKVSFQLAQKRTTGRILTLKLIIRDQSNAPRWYFFRIENSTYKWWLVSRLNFKHKSFLSTRSKTNNWESLHWSLLSRINLMPKNDISFWLKTPHICDGWCPDWILNTKVSFQLAQKRTTGNPYIEVYYPGSV